MKKINLLAFFLTITIGLVIAGPLGALAGAGVSMIPRGPSNVLMAGIFPEIWTGEMVKAFRHDDAASFLNTVRDYSQYAHYDAIHLIDVGADPSVLINNTTYPIPVQNLPDAPISISLDKFQTLATRITDDELEAIHHNKMESVIERHRAVITETKHDKAIHAFAPQSNTTLTPIVGTSGAVKDGRQTLTRQDIVALKGEFDRLKVPLNDRVLVLCSDHVNDLLLLDQKFVDQYYKYETGKIMNLLGFQIYEYVGNPYYNGTTRAKKAFGAALVPGTDFQASVAFAASRMFKCAGTTKTYLSRAENNPTTQENLINFRHRYIALPKKQEAIAAIVSVRAA